MPRGRPEHQIIRTERPSGLAGGSLVSAELMICFESIFIRMLDPQTKEVIKKDRDNLDNRKDKLQKQIKVEINLLFEAQDKPELKDFNSLSQDELKALNIILKGSGSSATMRDLRLASVGAMEEPEL